MVFLSGEHNLSTNITVANVVRLTMLGELSLNNVATIVCSGSVGLSFTSMVDFKILSLVFTACSREYDTPPVSNYALLLQSTWYAELVDCSFHSNYGTALVVNNTNITLAGQNDFTHNHCDCEGGGSITALSSTMTISGNTTFLENIARSNISVSCGGAIYATDHTVVSFNGTTNFINNSAYIAGAIYVINNSVFHFNGTSNFISNSAHMGGAIYSLESMLTFNGTNNMIGNLAGVGGGIYTETGAVIEFSGNTSFLNNIISSSVTCYGGAILLNSNSKLVFSGSINFTNNGHNVSRVDTIKGNMAYGGGVYVGVKGTLSMLPDTTVFWNNNHATYGGAIYVTDVSPLGYCASVATYVPKEDCFFQLPGQNLSNGDVKFVFNNNLADAAGSFLYGGVIDNCKLTDLDSYSSGEVFDKIAHNEDKNTTSRNSISSVPLQICPCNNNHPVCTPSASNYNVYPGETFQVPVLAVGQRNGIVPGTVRSIIQYPDQTEVDLKEDQYLQKTSNICTNINYTVSSLSPIVHIELHAEGNPCAKSDFSYLSRLLLILVNLNQTCPPGFNISKSARSCVCEQRLAQYTDKCHITDGIGRVTRTSSQQFWVGYDDQSPGLILHSHCPFEYCISHDEVVFSLNNTDKQCAYNRSGLLCGACKKGYSLVLGTSQCKQCTNSNLVLFILFALMGIALVLFLLVCKLTVATGTLSGLVFYANIVGTNCTLFLTANSVLSVFIAWLNLNFGIETCFYNGLDTYSKTWLQFVFPVYLWVLVGLMIIVSHYSQRFAKLLGNNPVSVLATLILLSYTKILRTLIAVVYVTYLEYPTYNKTVWLYDANINYLGSKHIPLFLVAVIFFLFLFLPYAFLLLFGQWLQAISHLRLFSWVNSARIKPFMDSYHAPYKAKHRYWPGLLLVVRFVLFVVFAIQFNPQQDRASINQLAILVGAGVLNLWVWISGGVYRNRYLDALEASFTLNMIILAASTLYTSHVSHSGENQLAVGYTSVSIAFATFIGILIFQVANVTGLTQYLKRQYAALKMCKLPIQEGEREIDSDNESLPDRLVNTARYEEAPQTTQECANADYVLTETSDSESEAPRLISVYT